jgi:hypothetical protein
MKNVFWDIKTKLVPHRRHITSPLQSPAGYYYVGFEFFTAVTMKNAVFRDVTPCGSCKKRRSSSVLTKATRRNIPEDSILRSVCCDTVQSRGWLPRFRRNIYRTLKMEDICSFETLV